MTRRLVVAGLLVAIAGCGPARKVAESAAASAPPPAIESGLDALAKPANQERLAAAFATPATAAIARTAAAGAVEGALAASTGAAVDPRALAAATRGIAAAVVLGIDDGLAAARHRPEDESGLAPLFADTRRAARSGLRLGVGALVGIGLVVAVLGALLAVQLLRSRRRAALAQDAEAALRLVRRLAREAGDDAQRARLAEAARAEGASGLLRAP